MFTTLSPVTALAQLHIDTRTVSPTTVCVVVAGEVDLATAPILRARLLGVIHDQAPEVIDVDLTGVRFLDCAGLGALVAAHTAAAHTGCHLWITRPRPIVHRLLELTGLLDLLTAPTDQPPPTARAVRARIHPAAGPQSPLLMTAAAGQTHHRRPTGPP